MANEAIVTGKSWTVAKAETTRGADISPSTSDQILVIDGFEMQKAQPNIRVSAESAFAPHQRSRPGQLSWPWSIGGGDIFPLQIIDANSYPLNWALLQLVGFGDFTYAVGPPKTLTATLLSAGHKSFTIKHYQRNEAGTTVIKKTLLGAMADGIIKGGAGQTLRVELRNGLAMSGSAIADDATAPGTITYQDSESNKELPFVCQGVTLSALASVEASPESLTADVVSFEIGINRSVTERTSITSTGGLSSVYDSAANYRTLQLVVASTVTGDWDPLDYWDNAKPIEVDLAFTSLSSPGTPGSAGAHCYLKGFWQIENVVEGDDAGRRIRTLTCHSISDESDGLTKAAATETGADPGEVAGDNLTIQFEYTT